MNLIKNCAQISSFFKNVCVNVCVRVKIYSSGWFHEGEGVYVWIFNVCVCVSVRRSICGFFKCVRVREI